MRLLGVTTLLIVLGTSSASAAPLAANKIVMIQNYAFNPATVTVNVGDTVTWTNVDEVIHSARATGGSFDTLTINPAQSKTITFTVAGTFAYICGVHGASMSGTVIVNGPPATPTPVPVNTPIPTQPPTPQPTVAPTPQPTVAPTASPTPAPATTAAATPAPTTPAPQPTQISAPTASAVSVVASSAPAPTAAAAQSGDSAPGPLLVAGGAVIIVGLVGAAFLLLRR